jgi:hypothetical protein
MFVIFLHGLPATGKYTIGKIVAERLGIHFFHNHLTVDLVGSLFAFGTPEFIRMREDIWVDCFEAAARSGESFVFTFNPESTVAPETLDKLEFAVGGNGGSIIYFELRCSIDEIEKRLADPARSQFGKLTDVGLFRKLYYDGAFESPVMPEKSIVIQTDELTPSACAETIVSEIGRLGV